MYTNYLLKNIFEQETRIKIEFNNQIYNKKNECSLLIDIVTNLLA